MRDYIRSEGSRYDVIQVEQNLLRFPRRDYRFGGIFIAKSVGLAHFYKQYEDTVERRLRTKRRDWGTLAGRIVRSMGRTMNGGLAVVENGFRTADQIHLNNGDELAFIKNDPRWREKAVLVKSGMSVVERQILSKSHDVKRRLGSSTIVFVGQWSYRKGKAEMPTIVRRVREVLPDVRFLLLGTSLGADSIVGQFDEMDRASIRVVSHYERSELPGLLAEARVGLLPSYIEGFGFAWLELLAAGLPVVSWDVPGVRQMLRELPSFMMLPPSSVEATAAGVLKVMKLDPPEYENLCERSQKVAAMFEWTEIAKIWERAVMEEIDCKKVGKKTSLSAVSVPSVTAL